jgi:hypothetical protein
VALTRTRRVYSETIAFLKPLIKSKGLLVIACPNFQSWEARYYKEFWAGMMFQDTYGIFQLMD